MAKVKLRADLSKPDFDAKPDHPVLKYLGPDLTLARIYTHKSGHDVFDWNPTPGGTKPRHASDGGRFDSTADSGTGGVIYAARADESADIAVTETLVPRARWSKKKQQRILTLAEVQCRSLVYFRLSKLLNLVDLTSPRGRSAFHAPASVTTSTRRDRTRLWGDYIRWNSPDNCHGIAYNSSQRGMSSNQVSFVLFESRCTDLNFMRVGPTIPLEVQAGLDIVQPVLADERIVIG